MIPVKVESVSSWTEVLVTATRLRNSYSQQISVILLHDHATHATPGKYPLCEPVLLHCTCLRIEQLTYCSVTDGLVNYIASALHWLCVCELMLADF
ncbi:hypothetical protein DY000_02049417 [Brassica cretica]|uniref:Uncharacterized protein n=1 Tax=Brassica cretica TaxID=69181 RepID=A0ABQ7ER06_BRACR|nr:hypothetical protein DY000_02049417 [Brassica cretica]